MGHREVCRCPIGWAGDPQTQCFKCRLHFIFSNTLTINSKIKNNLLSFYFLDECLVDNDCPIDKSCISKECKNPCLNTVCGSNALCKVEYHTPICYCPRGLQGNPQVSCIEVKCTTHQDCATNQICDYPKSSGSFGAGKECLPLCVKSPCAPGAVCSASNHVETCSCRPPLIGDGYASCAERKENLYFNILA